MGYTSDVSCREPDQFRVTVGLLLSSDKRRYASMHEYHVLSTRSIILKTKPVIHHTVLVAKFVVFEHWKRFTVATTNKVVAAVPVSVAAMVIATAPRSANADDKGSSNSEYNRDTNRLDGSAVASHSPSLDSGRAQQQRKQRRRRPSLRKNVFLRSSSCRGDMETGSNNGVASRTASAVIPTFFSSSSSPSVTMFETSGGRYAGVGELYPVMVVGSGGQSEMEDAADTVYYGWVVMIATWIVFVVGMGSVLGVWEWTWNAAEPPPWVEGRGKGEVDFPITGYYPAIIILSCIMAWVWVTVAWVGMKYFKHAKI